MHRTLKAEATRPAAGNLAAQQRKFNRFREEYNQERPHNEMDSPAPDGIACARLNGVVPINRRRRGVRHECYYRGN